MSMHNIELEHLSTKLVGQTVDSARLLAEENGCELRVTLIDGNPVVESRDWKPTRFNVAVTGGVVTRVLRFG